MLSGRWTVVDPDLGDCTVIRGSGRMIAALAIASGVMLWFAWGGLQPPPSGCSSCSSSGLTGFALWLVSVLVCWFCALLYWRAQFVVGQHGFRWDKPLRPLQAAQEVRWNQVTKCDVDVDGRFLTQGTWLVVTLSDGGHLSIGRKMSASWWEICDLMNERRDACRESRPEDRRAGRAEGQPETVG